MACPIESAGRTLLIRLVGLAAIGVGLVYLTWRDNSKGGNLHIFTISIDGTNLQQVTHSKLWDSAADWGTH